MKSFKRGEKGFTLIELLIVVAILGVLAAVVIPNVVGLMGRGGKQAYSTDTKTIQLAAATFYSDTHGGFVKVTTAWGCNVTATTEKTGHFYPTSLGFVTSHYLSLGTAEDPDPGKLGSGNMRIMGNGTNPAVDAEIATHAIWMGLLVHSNLDYVKLVTDPLAVPTGTIAAGTLNRWSVTTIPGENDLYLNELPRSASVANGAAQLKAGGYTWIVGQNGVVYGVYKASDNNWYNGFSGGYP